MLTRWLRLLCLFTVVTGVMAAYGGPIEAADAPELLALRAGRGVEGFVVLSPEEQVSEAVRDNTDLADKKGQVPANTPGYRMYSTVIVWPEDARVLNAWAVADARVAGISPLEAAPGFYLVQTHTVRQAIEVADDLSNLPGVKEAYVDVDQPKSLRVPTDPGYPSQWHLNNTQIAIADLNVVPVWDTLGFTGGGITTGIIEGGFQTTHPDLSANYNATASQSGGSSTSHGSSCAGLVAAVANNGTCGAGVAYTGKVAKLLNGTSSANATAFGFRNDLNFVKSNSWGPADNGLITYMTSAERTALANAVATGRSNKGTIFAWAAGNGGTADRCDYDPYASSRYTLAIGAIGDQDTRSSFNETGSSMFVVCPSSGNVRNIYSTRNANQCTSAFGGTSAACPIGAGAVVLMLQANPNLTWRDVQHVLVNSARKCNPTNSLWTVNGAGHDINYNYGFGAVDALAAVTLAQSWVNVAAQQTLTTGVVAVNTTIPDNNATGVTRNVTASGSFSVESVELVLNATMTYVGDLKITLTSPSGSQSLLAVNRADPTDNYVNYVFTSVRHWDEPVAGTWTINIADLAAQDVATWTNYEFRLQGTP